MELFGELRYLRDRAFSLLDGRQAVQESRDLFFLAAATCGMLADITKDFGYFDAAMTHTRTGLLCARQSGDPALTAWIHAEQSVIAYWAGRPAQAASLARLGAEAGGAARGSIAAYLPGLEARAAAQIGNAERARDALGRAATAREQVRSDNLDELGGITTFSTNKQHFYAATSYALIGDSPAALHEAESAVAGYEQEPEPQRAVKNQSLAHLDAAVAHAVDGDLDGAKEAVLRGLSLRSPAIRDEPFDLTLKRVHRAASGPQHRGSPVATEVRDQIEDFLAAPEPAALPGL